MSAWDQGAVGGPLPFSNTDGGGEFVRDDQVAIQIFLQEGAAAPELDEMVARVRTIVPAAREIQVSSLTTKDSPFATDYVLPAELIPVEARDPDPSVEHLVDGRLAVANTELLDLLGVPETLRKEIDSGGVVGVSAPPFRTRAIELEGQRLPFHTFDSRTASGALPSLLVSSTMARRLGLESRPGPTVIDARKSLTAGQRERLRTLSGDFEWELTRWDDPIAATASVYFPIPRDPGRSQPPR